MLDKELMEFLEKFAKNRWKESPDGTVDVDDYLFLNNYKGQLPESFGNLKIGGYLSLNNYEGQLPSVHRFGPSEVGDDYIYADGILWELLNTRRQGNLTVYKCVFGYIVSNGDVHAHGKTLRQAKSDLNFKLAQRDPDQFKDLDLDEVRPVEEVITIYRVITGACSTGCEMFTAANWNKKTITLRQACELTANAYGGKQFARFYSQVG